MTSAFLTSSNTASVTVTKNTGTVSGPATQPVQVASGQAGAVTITVARPYSGVAAASGSITYTILNASNAVVGSGSLPLTAGSTSSSATVPIPSSLAPGNYTVSVTYGGDSNYAASAAATTIQVKVGLIAPAVALTSSVNPVVMKDAVTFTATVSSSSSTPTGSVSELRSPPPIAGAFGCKAAV